MTGGSGGSIPGLSNAESDFPIFMGTTSKVGAGKGGTRECHQCADRRTIQNGKICERGKSASASVPFYVIAVRHPQPDSGGLNFSGIDR